MGQIASEAELPQESVGQQLRNARLRRGDELSQVSHTLRIGKAYLQALESDSPDKLPGRTYAIGFVRAYAKHLGLDSSSLVTRYKLATAGLADSAPQVGPAPETGRFRLDVGWTLSALAAAGLVVLGIYEMSRPAAPAAPKPAGTAAPIQARMNSHATRAHVVAALAQTPPGASPAAVPTATVLGVQNHGARVVLHARALTHVLVDGPGGKVYINRVLHPGDVYRVPNMVGLSLTTPNGGAVSLELDGRDMGAAGKGGRLVEALSLDPTAIADRKSAGVPGAPEKVTP